MGDNLRLLTQGRQFSTLTQGRQLADYFPYLDILQMSPWMLTWCELPMIQSVRYST